MCVYVKFWKCNVIQIFFCFSFKATSSNHRLHILLLSNISATICMSAVLVIPLLFLMCCHVAPPTGQQEGDMLVCCSSLSGTKDTSLTKAAVSLVVVWKSTLKAQNKAETFSVTNRERSARLIVPSCGTGKESAAYTREPSALSLRLSLCSGCAKLFTRVFKRQLGGISTLALWSLRSSFSALQKLGILSWRAVYSIQTIVNEKL